MSSYQEVFQLAQDKGFTGLDKWEIILMKWKTTWIHNDVILLHATLIQKWLRDEHKIDVLIQRPTFADPMWYEWLIITEDGLVTDEEDSYVSYEEALLAGIEEALKLIK
jgi:hypothetical protein